MPHITKENVADRITELLIEHFDKFKEKTINDEFIDLSYFQKVVRYGVIQQAGISRRTDDEKLVLYKSDVKANEEDIELLDYIYNTYFAADELSLTAIQLNIDPTAALNPSSPGELGIIGPTYHDFITLIIDNDIITFNNGSLTETFYQDNLGQFVDFRETYMPIDPIKAHQILNTNIYELLPPELTKQQRINRFFSEYADLKPDPPPTETMPGFDRPALENLNPEDDALTETYNEEEANAYSDLYDISNAVPGQEADRFINWHEQDDLDNTNRSLEWLRNDLNNYYFLQEEVVPEIKDERPEYEPVSEGYLKIRTLNQAIIIRNEEKSDIGLIGPDPFNPIWHDTGFTITMWVRFLDKVNSGTLFNFGNPLREDDPSGFMLETFIVEEESYAIDGAGFEDSLTFDQTGFFLIDDVERFIRLVVRDGDGNIRDSHVGNPWIARTNTQNLNTKFELDDNVSPFNYTQIPINLREWYFIVATYNPNIDEDESFEKSTNICVGNSGHVDDCNYNPDFWRWNINPETNEYISNSELGAQCKVEIISRSDLLRARGFKA